MAIDISAFLPSKGLRLGPLSRGVGGPRGVLIPGTPERLMHRFCDLKYFADNAGEAGFKPLLHLQMIYDARQGNPAPITLLRLLEAGIVTDERDYITIRQGSCRREARPEAQLGPRTIVIDRDTALIKLTRGFAEQSQLSLLHGPSGLLHRAGNPLLRSNQLLGAISLAEVQALLVEMNRVLPPAGLRLSIPREPAVEIAFGQPGTSFDDYSIACLSSYDKYGEETTDGSYVSKSHQPGRLRERLRPDEPANFLLEVEFVKRTAEVI
jgi:hypothetical protein